MEKQTIEVNPSGSEHWPDFIVRAWMINEVVVGVEAFEVGGRNGDDADDALLFEMKDAKRLPDDMTTDLDKAETIVEGSIKWDGCSDLTMGYMHHCSRRSVATIGPLLDRLFEIAAEMMGDRADESAFEPLL